jgi:hypothetical protein
MLSTSDTSRKAARGGQLTRLSATESDPATATRVSASREPEGGRPASTSDPAATGSGSPAVTLTYVYQCSDGQQRVVLIALEESGAWLVYDAPGHGESGETGLLVERIDGSGDLLGEALGVARTYVADQQTFHAGERLEPYDPLPKAQTVPLTAIREHAENAARAVHRHPDQTAAHAA